MVHETEQETVEAIKRWLQQNGTALVAGLAIGLAGVFGWQYWQSHQRTQAESASTLYEALRGQLDGDDPAGAQDLYNRLKAEYADTAYASLGALTRAGQAVTDGDLDLAHGALQWVIENSPLPELVAIARLRLARVLRAQGKGEESLAQLDALNGAFEPEAEEIRGDVLVDRGERERAREAYRAAAEAYARSGRPNRWLQLKLDDLAPPQAVNTPEGQS
jgi:predicted negative regulator of RcsB-dependent stress response